MRTSSPRAIFWTRLWAFLNYRTTIRLTWLELLTLSLVGLMLAWIGLRDWVGLAIVAPIAFYLLVLGFYQELRIPVGWVRALYRWLFKPLGVPDQTNKRIYALGVVGATAIVTIALWLVDLRLALLFGILLGLSAILLWAIDERETMGGTFQLNHVAGRLPILQILDDGEIVDRDGTRAKIALITLGRTGYKPALKAVDVAETLTKFLAYLAQYEGARPNPLAEPASGEMRTPEGGLPIKLFWLTDYHLGQLDLGDADGYSRVSAEYVEELRVLAETGARKARVIITGIVYPTAVEERIREWLTQVDLGLSPLGAFAAESLLRNIFLGESFLGQIQSATLSDGGGLPLKASRGFSPNSLAFGAQLKTEQQVLTATGINTPFAEARDALMRALQSVDGWLAVTLQPLPRDK